MTTMTGERAPSTYELRLASEDAAVLLDVHGRTAEGGAQFLATLQHQGKTMLPEKNPLSVPKKDDDQEVRALFWPEGGIDENFGRPGVFAPIVSHLGFLYGQSDTTRGGVWTKEMRFQYSSADAMRAMARQILPSNGIDVAPAKVGFYDALEFFEPLIEKKRIVPDPEVSLAWSVHDAAMHVPGEYALGPEFNELRMSLIKQLLDKHVKNPDSERLDRAMLLDDFLSESITSYILRSDGSDIVPLRRLPLQKVFSFYLESDAFQGTTIDRLRRAMPRKPGEFQPFIMDAAAEVKQRLTDASKLLGYLNA
jgi:hypothetical protein